MVSLMIKKNVLSKFSNSMRISGFDEAYRFEIIKGALDLYSKCDEETAMSNRVICRNKEQIEAKKKEQLGKFSNTWFLEGTTTNVINVPCTPGGRLASEMSKSLLSYLGPDKGSTDIIESAGKSISGGLAKSDPFGSKSCPFCDSCIIGEGYDCLQ